eukprot:TRINITY_DN3253_c0_g1_i11.p1 TRINITY_DN3253_c0_g1~~TRINITY_DN3253_c0_g1_i11.p1  ORF type:complete len:242 (-),score=50.60 TRINITY_DN3253_c0_g1_i11:523-1248(-)
MCIRDRVITSANRDTLMHYLIDDKKPDIMDPDLINLISAVSQVLHDQILEDLEDGKTIDENDDYYVFSEDKYINERFDMDQDNENIKAAIEELKRVPTVEDIANFLASLFEMSQLKGEVCLTALVYINRLIALKGMPLITSNWRPCIFISIFVAQKVLHDNAYKTSDFAQMYPFFEKEDVNSMEQAFLQFIDYDISVSRSLYSKYYFHLRTLYEGSDFPEYNESFINKIEEKNSAINKQQN